MSDATATHCSEIYLDANATTPILPAAQAAMIRVLSDNFGNPGSPHGAGIRARIELDRARAAVAAVLQLPADDLIFTSGATEGIQTAVLSALYPQRSAALVRVLYGATEHKAVPEALAHWGEILGLTLELLPIPVDQQGRHDLCWLAENAKGAALVCTMAANNETGAISDLDGIAGVLDALPVRPLWLVDGVQALGKLAVDWLGLRIDYAPFSGHKLHAPKGIGLLYARAGAPFTRLLAGGGQESNARCGTENLPGIAALGAVCEALLAGQFGPAGALAVAQQRLKTALQHAFPQLMINSPSQHCLPTTINFSLLGIPSKCLLDLFDALGLRLSAGSACNSKNAKPSFVLMAMGLGEERASSAIRLSISPNVCAADIDAAVERIALAGHILQTHLNDMLQLEQVALPDEDLELSSRYAVTAEQLPAWIAAHPAGVLIDIREQWEQAACCPSLGLTIAAQPLSQLPTWLSQIALDQPLLLACRSGRRSGQLLSLMRAKGYSQTWHLADGLAGLPMPSVAD
ncbi:aminotransferase class V-fold PLP-dependent enzyme [Deefgea piscis]|uniref:aminotransferase class V-fold PLP-dependent enzyme n=1 Tax=Deefgea piscis TaxID=2739061 RepID=UPI001C7F6F38|nr:aminotransferase class V-fold PLP-dependent enzyme [Deefgea piscis]QZA81453.1 aminotransferase class V-fold PLP-dependent enzyme [Deefgea piscis]